MISKKAPASFEAGAGGFLSRLGGRRAAVAHGRVVWRVWRALCGVWLVRLCVDMGNGLRRLERIVARHSIRAKEKPARNGGPCWVLSSFCKVCQYEDGQQNYRDYPDHAVASCCA